MSVSNLCRLCVNLCQDYKSIYDAGGQRNEVYDITVKYFHPMFLNVEQGGSHLTVMCLDCWHQIYGFYRFQESILLAQTKLLGGEKQISQSLEKAPADVNSSEGNDGIETIDLPDLELMDIYTDNPSATADDTKIDTPMPSQNMSADNDSCEDYDDIEDDEPIGYFTGGSFDNANDGTAHCHSELETIKVESSSSDEDEIYLVEDDVPVNTNHITETSNQKSATVACDRATSSSKACFTQSTKTSKRKRPKKSPSQIDAIIAEWKPQLECVVCHTLLASFSLLQRHFDDDHPNEECYILCCNLKLTKRYKIERHIRCHKGAGTAVAVQHAELDDFIEHYEPHLTCPICDEKRSSFGQLKKHFLESHRPQQCYIECCKRKLVKRCSIVEHMQVHIDRTIFQCKLCHICYLSKVSLHQHMATQHAITKKDEKRVGARITFKELDDSIARMMPQLKCVLCLESCITFTALQAHYRQRHYAEQECYIECCERKFHKPQQLEEHLLLHNDPMAFKCQQCDEYFTSRSSLYNHGRLQHPLLDLHSNDIHFVNRTQNLYPAYGMDNIIAQCKPTLPCYVCHEPSRNFGQLQTHFQHKHPNDVCYIVCCHQKFHCRSRFAEHCKLCHGTVTTVVGCIRKSAKQLDKFIAKCIPKLECDICHKMFSTFTLLQKHFHQEHPAEKCYIICCQRKLTQRYNIEKHILLLHDTKKPLTENKNFA